MSAFIPHQWTAPARARTAQITAALGTPAAIALTIAAWRFGGPLAATLVAIASTAAIAAIAHVRARRYDAAWLVRGLDARRADLEDSADLLVAPDASLTPLQRLQRDRLFERLAAEADPDLRPAWPKRAIAACWIAAALAIAALLLRRAEDPHALAPSSEGLPAAPGVPRLIGQRLRITPPAYTGLPSRGLTTLDARAPEGSRIAWTLAFSPAPASAVIAFHDGGRIALRRGATWQATTILARSTLYRIVPAGTDRLPPLHRLEAIPDRAPRVGSRQRTLTLVARGQRVWSPVFEATDDYGVNARGTLRITLAQGEGENVTFAERTIPITGSGSPRARRFAPSLGLAGVGFSGVGDLIVQVTVADARGHVVRGPSLILRRPAPVADAGTGLEGAVKKALPAYFRSQRQIIIDAQALLKQRSRLAPSTFLERSDTIGVDQRTLRLRYGQFLGEESEGPSLALPTSDAEKEEHASPHAPGDGHDHAPAPDTTSPTVGRADDVLADYGHAHDESEAATLLDPGTRETLRKALGEMWQSELHLRQGDPARALPYANRALVFIKRVQQATRIFLRRTGTAQPEIDETRRLSGKRDGLAGGTLPLAAPPPGVPEPAATWRALATGPVRLDALERWLRGAAVPDRLALASAIDTVRREPACAGCRARLRRLLWAALPRPVPKVARRNAADAQGRRYLDALPR